jgi:L-lactate dehydrogenase
VCLSALDVTDVRAPKRQNRKRIRIPRVAIVGAGFVGSTTAYALLISGTAAEIVLIDKDRRRAEGHMVPTANGVPVSSPLSFYR